MIDRETAFVGMKVIRKSDGRQLKIKNINQDPNCSWPFFIEDPIPSGDWYGASALAPIAEPEKPLEATPTAETKREPIDALNEGDQLFSVRGELDFKNNNTLGMSVWLISGGFTFGIGIIGPKSLDELAQGFSKMAADVRAKTEELKAALAKSDGGK